MPLSLLDRYRGAIIGVHAGDSLAAPYENQEPETITRDIVRRGGLVPFEYLDPWGIAGVCPAGRPTDDSILTAALAQSLIECKGSDPAHQYRYFKRAVGGKQSFLWGHETTTFGRTTRLMLKSANYARACERPDRPVGKSNGSLMRSVPLVLWYHKRNRWALIQAVAKSSMVTHLHVAATESCKVYVTMLDFLLRGDSPSEAWKWTRQFRSGVKDESLQRLLRPHTLPVPEATNVWLRDTNPAGLAGSALHTLHIAIWSTLHAIDFQDGIIKAVAFGGDTDTQCAVAGGLLGAYFGIESIPSEWRSVLKGGDRMISLADQLHG